MDHEEKKNPVALSEDGLLRLAGVWTVEKVTALKDTLLTKLVAKPPKTVDISQIDWMDTAGIQLLLALAFSLGEGVNIRGANQDVQRVLEVSGATTVLRTRGVRVDFNVEV